MSERGRKKEEKFRLNVTDNSSQEVDLVPVNEDTQDVEGLNVDSLAEEHAEPSVVATKDGRMIIEMKPGKTCQICGITFVSAKVFKKHKDECLEKISQFADVLEKEKNAAMLAQPGEEFYKYCNPNPENPCYCCGEDISTAHVGHLKCKLCPKSFKAYDYLERHLQSVHSESDDYSCRHCNAKCPSEKVLTEHLSTHTEGKPFSCIKCGKDFTRKYHLERHLNHSKCGEIPKLQLPCEVCGKIFTRLDNLREHLRYHMGEAKRKRDYQCPHCEKGFYGSSLLNIHIRTHTGEKPFPCDLCTKSFPSTGALRKHRRSHTGERPYRCDECSATFAAKETLNRHRRTHTGDKPHKCTLCDKKFIQATQLRSHMFKHTGENGYKCQECAATFNRKSRLQEHVRFVHMQEPMLSCEICSKTFTRNEDLGRHLESHSDVKDVPCDQCGKLFGSQHAMKVHTRTHLIEEHSFCPICDKKFKRRDCLIRHVRSSHRECPDALSLIPPKKEPIQQQVLLEIEEVHGTIEQAMESEQMELMHGAEDEQMLEIDGMHGAEDEQMLEIDGEVYQITPLEDIRLVKINTRRKDSINEPLQTNEMFVDEIEIATPKLEPVPVEIRKAVKIKRSLSVKPTELSLVQEEFITAGPAIKKNEPENVTPVKEAPNKKKLRSLSVKPPDMSLVQEEFITEKPVIKKKEPASVTPVKKVPNKKKMSAKPPNMSPVQQKIITAGPVIEKKEPATPVKETPNKKKMRKAKAKEPVSRPMIIPATKIKIEQDDSMPIFMSDAMLREKISELLCMLIDEEMLVEFGWPKTPVDRVLGEVIQRCGHKPVAGVEYGDITTRMRENTKILFSLTMEDDNIRTLLNNHTIDEVIMSVLKSK
ncbi:protein suppressor of hairy wing-like [Armigeres subalbatus]|uniref:protein suppressor of hairy wing-like n=1 Tax=Armigeres subalbatus TaxID=124917 RepID=UPI002ED114CE